MNPADVTIHCIHYKWSPRAVRWQFASPFVKSFVVTEGSLTVTLLTTGLPDIAFRGESIWRVVTPDYDGDGQPPAEYATTVTRNHVGSRLLCIEARRTNRPAAKPAGDICGELAREIEEAVKTVAGKYRA